MRKPKRPPFDELIDRFCVCIQNREPGRMINAQVKMILSDKWKNHKELLYKNVIKAEQNEKKVISVYKNTEVRKVEFQIGFSISGQPIFVTHFVKFENEINDPKRYKKQGSDFVQKLKSQATFQNILF